MINPLSFMSANFVARELGYRMSGGWPEGEAATNAFFAPLDSFAERFDAMLEEIGALGFERLDLWTAHLNFRWATPEHVAIARELLRKHKLRAVSYAGGFGGSRSELRACCRLAHELRIPVLGGSTPLLESDRGALVAQLREFGLIFALENHPEKTPGELLARLGSGDEDVIGVAADTGWFATQGCDAARALRALAGRLKHVHLKDVRAAGAHATCRLGDGIVPVEACVRALREMDYRGVISIEHESENADPRQDVQVSTERVRAWQRASHAPPAEGRLRVAVVGCGNISHAYGSNLASYPEIAIIGAHDLDPARAEQFVQTFGGRTWKRLDDVLADAEVDVVLNLTIHHAHVEVITRALEAGKHVHTEKPMALNHADARQLVRLARRQRRRLSSAPTTWMGEAQQTAWKLVRDGTIGTPRVGLFDVGWGRIETWHPNPAPFYDVGVMFDVAVYPLTLMTAWFGPVRRVTAGGKLVLPERRTKEGTPFRIHTPEWQVMALEFESGFIARLTASFYVGRPTRQRDGFEIHGDLGSVVCESWGDFSAPVFVGPFGGELRPVPLVSPPYHGIEFARGLVELAAAWREKRPHRAGAEHAAHVIEVIEAGGRALSSGRAQKVRSSFPPPAPF